MNANAFVASFGRRLSDSWNWARTQLKTIPLLMTGAVFICLYLGIVMQRQAQPQAKQASLNTSRIAHLQLNDWVAEYFSCNQGQCKRVFKRLANGNYEVALEKLPLGSDRNVNDKAFSMRPTYVKLSHRLSEEEASLLSKNWPNERPVLAMAEQPVCEKNVCRRENLALPFSKMTIGDRTWLQFDSHIAENGHFGPQSLPPLVVGQSSAQEILSFRSAFQRGLIFELGLTALAPLFVFALTLWFGMPLTFLSFAHFLTARAAWSLAAADTFLNQPLILSALKLKDSYALSAFLSGWVAATLATFLCAVWQSKKIDKKNFETLWALTSIVALLGTYVFQSGTPAAVLFLRTFDTLTLVVGACALGLAWATHSFPEWNSRISKSIRELSQIEQGARWKEQLTALTWSFSAAAVFSFWVGFQSRANSYVFHWGELLLPICATAALMYARPQLTPADVQSQKNFVTQQESLVKLISQLGTFKHRAQAISLVVNFCNRELPKLGFETPTFSDQKPAPLSTEDAEKYEVCIEANIKGPNQSFGWLVARAAQCNESTAIGERIVEALSIALAQHLDNLTRGGWLENELNSVQKFVPRGILKLFSLENLTTIEHNHDYTLEGSVVCVVLRQNANTHEGREQLDRSLVTELNELFAKGVSEYNGYVVAQEGMRWSVIFRERAQTTIKWIESTQHALNDWNQRRQNLGFPAHEFSFGAHSSALTLRFSEDSGLLRPWISFDAQGIAASLAEVAPEYSAAVLLSQDYVSGWVKSLNSHPLPDAVRPLERLWNRNKTATVDVFEFFGGDSDLRRAAKQRSVELFSQGIRLYLTGYFDGARSIMSQILETDPHDRAAQRLVDTLSQSEELRAA